MNAPELVFTTRGNLPASTLKREVEWEFHPTRVVHKEFYKLGDEIVKSSADVFQLPEGMVFNTQQGQLNG